MNNLEQIQNENIDILTVDSREVAEMMEIRHTDLLRKIDKINKDFTERKIALSKYWIESTYKDTSGKENKCLNITKRGCEFLAHKTTGTKGNLFTHYYMERFEELEKIVFGNKRLTSNDLDIIVINKIDDALNELKHEYSRLIRPLAKDKYQISKYIKQRLGIEKANDDYKSVKLRTLGILRVNKWEDIPYDQLNKVYSLIDDAVDAITKTNAIKQMKLF